LGWSSAVAKAHAPQPKMAAHHTYYFAAAFLFLYFLKMFFTEIYF